MQRGNLLLIVCLCSMATFAIEVTGAEPTTALGYFERGLKLERENKRSLALADYSRAIKLDTRFTAAYWSRSAIYGSRPELEKRDYSKAAADLTSVIEIEPKGFSAWYNRGHTYECMGEYDKSIADYTTAISGDLDFTLVGDSKSDSLARVHHYRGRVYQWNKQDFAKAVADYDAALRLNPKIEMVHYRRGQSYHALKEYAKAQDDFTVALEADPDYGNLLNSTAWLLATCPDQKYRNAQTAVQYASRASEKWEGKHAEFLDVLAAAHAEATEFGKAIEAEKSAIEILGSKGPKRREAMEARLKLYEAGKPFRTE
jgi:tetratricopeptide (TPR) repeat protein